VAQKSHAGFAENWKAIGNDIPSIQAFGLDVVTALCARLLETGAHGLYFYPHNSAVLP